MITAEDAWVVPQDLEDWFALAPTLKWRFASSMPTVPHSYVVRGKSLDEVRYRKAFGTIRTFGTPGKFFDRTNLYLHDPDTNNRWWLMSRHDYESKILNMASDGKMYGDQNAQTTENALFTPYDHIAAYYDDVWSAVDRSEKIALWKTVTGMLGGINPRTLDLGAGTGGTLDAKVAGAPFTTAVEPSQGMLNDLVMKHPRIGQIISATAEEYLSWETGATYDLVIASFGSASYLSPEAIDLLPAIARGGVVLSFYSPEFKPTYYKRGEFDGQLNEGLQVALDFSKGMFEQQGDYMTITIRGEA